MSSRELLSAESVAKRYNKPISWVYHCKELKAIRRRVGKYLFYLEDDLLELEQKWVVKTQPNYVQIHEVKPSELLEVSGSVRKIRDLSFDVA